VTLSGRRATILLVEDNRLDIELTLDAFKVAQSRNDLRIVRNGQEALDYIFGREPYQDRRKSPFPDIVLLDLKLPGIDGFEVLRQIKSTPAVKRLPVIVLTSSREEGDLIRSYDIGANSYLVKPLRPTSFPEVIRQVDLYWLTLNTSPPLT